MFSVDFRIEIATKVRARVSISDCKNAASPAKFSAHRYCVRSYTGLPPLNVFQLLLADPAVGLLAAPPQAC